MLVVSQDSLVFVNVPKRKVKNGLVEVELNLKPFHLLGSNLIFHSEMSVICAQQCDQEIVFLQILSSSIILSVSSVHALLILVIQLVYSSSN